VALVLETQSDCGSRWEAIVLIAEKVGVSAESLRRWVRQAEVGAGRWVGASSGDAGRFVGCGGRIVSCGG